MVSASEFLCSSASRSEDRVNFEIFATGRDGMRTIRRSVGAPHSKSPSMNDALKSSGKGRLLHLTKMDSKV